MIKVPSFLHTRKKLYGVKKSANETRFNKKKLSGGDPCNYVFIKKSLCLFIGLFRF